MKKLLAIMCAAFCITAMTACGDEKSDSSKREKKTETTTAAEAEKTEEENNGEAEETEEVTESLAEKIDAANTEASTLMKAGNTVIVDFDMTGVDLSTYEGTQVHNPGDEDEFFKNIGYYYEGSPDMKYAVKVENSVVKATAIEVDGVIGTYPAVYDENSYPSDVTIESALEAAAAAE